MIMVLAHVERAFLARLLKQFAQLVSLTIAAVVVPSWNAVALGPVVSITLAWEPSADADVVGYSLYYGAASHTYTNKVGVGPATSATIPNLVPGITYFFAATASDSEGLESDFSNEVSYLVGRSFISGHVKTAAGVALSGVTLGGLPGSPVTDSTGYYSATVAYGWSGTATPSQSGYSFSPASRTYTNVTANQTAQNYTGTLFTYVISGYVKTAAGVAISGVALGGLPGSPVTDSTGYYGASVTYGWSGTATPSLSGYSFSPASRTYNNVSATQAGQDYTGTVIGAEVAYVTGEVLGAWRTNLNAGTNLSAWQGMKILVGNQPLTVTALGRWCASGSSGAHTVKLVQVSTKADVAGGTVALSMAGAPAGQFRYGALASPVTLATNTAYYLVSYESNGGDAWYNYNTTVTTTPVAQCQGAAYSYNGSTWGLAGTVNNTYGPLDFKYTIGGSQSSGEPAFVAGSDGPPNPAAVRPAMVSAPVAPSIRIASLWNGRVRVEVSGNTGPECHVLASANLTDWTDLGAVALGQDGSVEFDDPGETGVRCRFYRLVWP
jgi:hypothetical protein